MEMSPLLPLMAYPEQTHTLILLFLKYLLLAVPSLLVVAWGIFDLVEACGIQKVVCELLGFPGGSVGEEPAQLRQRCRRGRFDPWV